MLIRSRRLPILAISLALLGIGLDIESMVLNSLNRGSCPALQPGCDHTMTIGGMTFWIRATADSILILGALVLAASLGICLYWVRKGKSRRMN
jgi:hypothetical protein